jgi:hypothetical protein
MVPSSRTHFWALFQSDTIDGNFIPKPRKIEFLRSFIRHRRSHDVIIPNFDVAVHKSLPFAFPGRLYCRLPAFSGGCGCTFAVFGGPRDAHRIAGDARQADPALGVLRRDAANEFAS